MIKSGAVFVFSVEESGIKRWTDGLLWSPSRIVGNFLVYREINERTSSRGSHKKPYPLDSSSRGLSTHRTSPDQTSAAFKGPGHLLQTHGSTDQGTFKLNGLIKKTITVTVEGSDLHLISYYTSEDIRSGKLKRPSNKPDIMALHMPPHIFRLTNFRVPPKVDIGPDGKPRLVCEPEDQEPVECKIEEQTYQVPDSPQWSPTNGNTTSIDGVFGSSMYQDMQTHSPMTSPTLSSHSRESAGDRWPIPLDSLRISSSVRQDIDWSPSPSPTNPHSVSRRRDTTTPPQSGSWPSIQPQSGRWRPDSYDSSIVVGPHLERSNRVRSSTLYQDSGVGPHRSHRESESMSGFHNRLSVDLGGGRESGHQRLPWLPRESSGVDKHLRNSQTESPFTPSPTSQFSSHHGYHRPAHSYGTWSSNVNSLAHSSQLHPIPSHSSLHSYATSYTSSPEDLSNVEDFGDP